MEDVPHGWRPDPYGLHEDRYFSRGNPTKLVRDGGQEAYDEVPDAVPATPATVDADPPTPVEAMEPVSAVATHTATMPAGFHNPSPIESPPPVHEREAVRPAPRRDASVEAAPRRSRRRTMLGVTAFLVVALVAALAITLSKGNGPSRQLTPANQYLAAANAFDASQARLTGALSKLSTTDPQFVAKYDAAYTPEIGAIEHFKAALQGIPWPNKVEAAARAEERQLGNLSTFVQTLVRQPTLTALKGHVIRLVVTLNALGTATNALRHALGLPPLGNETLNTTTTTASTSTTVASST